MLRSRAEERDLAGLARPCRIIPSHGRSVTKGEVRQSDENSASGRPSQPRTREDGLSQNLRLQSVRSSLPSSRPLKPRSCPPPTVREPRRLPGESPRPTNARSPEKPLPLRYG